MNDVDKQVLQKSIDCVFSIMEDHEKVKKIEDFQNRIGFKNDFFTFNALLDINEGKLVSFLDWYFFGILNVFNPNGDLGGLVSYTLYDAAIPRIGNKRYDLKDKKEFTDYVMDCLEKEIRND